MFLSCRYIRAPAAIVDVDHRTAAATAPGEARVATQKETHDYDEAAEAHEERTYECITGSS